MSDQDALTPPDQPIKRGFGYKPNTQDDSHGHAPELFKASPYLLAKPDLRKFATDANFNGYALDQGQAGSCWAFATTRDLQMFYAIRKISAPLASPRFLYWNARNEAYAGLPPDADRKLEDEGTEPRLGLRALSALGFVSIDDCPYSDNPVVIEKRPSDDTYALAYSQKGLKYGSIRGTGRARVDACADLMRRGYTPQFGMMVDSAFMGWTPSKGPINAVDERRIQGGHMLAVVCVDYAKQLVWFQNSWDQWGTPEGFGYMSFKLFGSSTISDVAAIEYLATLARKGA